MTTDSRDTTTTTPPEASPDSTGAWEAADRRLMERLATPGDTVWNKTKRRWWQRKPLPWLVFRQYTRKQHLVGAHRWEWFAEVRSVRREGQHRSEVGVFYTVRHRSHVTKAGEDR